MKLTKFIKNSIPVDDADPEIERQSLCITGFEIADPFLVLTHCCIPITTMYEIINR